MVFNKKTINKLCIKIFIQRKTRAAKTYANRIFLSFKKPATYIYFFNSRRTAVSVVKQLLSDMISSIQKFQIFTGVRFGKSGELAVF